MRVSYRLSHILIGFAAYCIAAGTARAASESVVYAFTGGADGGEPLASLLDVDGVLYGTTSIGGSDMNGTVFKVTTAGAETVLHSFGSGRRDDGKSPASGVIEVGGTIYGTTVSGGKQGVGAIFQITQSGAESVLSSFNRTNGQDPTASLTNVGGKLFGTASGGGDFRCPEVAGGGGCGTVFKVTTDGPLKVVHMFAGDTDGLVPSSSLISVAGALYGTTVAGGGTGCGGYEGCGTVFRVTSAGVQIIHSFLGGAGGGGPNGLVDVGGTLYGTTFYGGQFGGGTVFKISPAGVTTVLYSFRSSSADSYCPTGGLLYVGGALYGTTFFGGKFGGGTVFEVTKAGRETVLHSFGHGSDGTSPQASLINVGRTLYGTTTLGGAFGYGTVFKVIR